MPVSEYLGCHIVLRRPLLLTGGFAREVANMISCTISASGISVILLPRSVKEAKQLHDAIEKCPNNVVLIEGAILNCDESAYLPLLKNCPNDKQLLFSLDLADHISLLPLGLLNWLSVFDTDNLIKRTTYTELVGAVINPELYNLNELGTIDEGNKRNSWRRLEPLRHHFSYSYLSDRAELMRYWRNPLVTLLTCEVIPLMRYQGKTEQLKEWLDRQQLSRDDLQLIYDLCPELETV